MKEKPFERLKTDIVMERDRTTKIRCKGFLKITKNQETVKRRRSMNSPNCSLIITSADQTYSSSSTVM
jgi:hypothetical protein